MTKQEIIDELKGVEIKSIQYEDVVYFDGNKLYGSYRGKIKSVSTMSKAETLELWNEYIEQEFGTRNVAQLMGLV